METRSNSKSSTRQGEAYAHRHATQTETSHWVTQLALHKKMTAAYQELASARKHVARNLDGLRPSDTVDTQADLGIRPLPAACRVRMALRLGLADVQRRDPALRSPQHLLTEELDYLSLALKRQQSKIEDLEKQILAARPKDAAEARILLSFLSRLIAAERRIDPVVMASFIEANARILAPDQAANFLHQPGFCRFS